MKKENPSPAEAIAFTTPVIKVDNNTGLALLVVRDGSTGEELDQYPSKKVVEEYQRVQGSTPAPTPATDSSAPADGGAALAAGAVVPPVAVAAPPVSPATGDARTTTTVSTSSGVKPVTN
ncbi:hypothetical protein [Paramagnetospirillum marisnigri]|uniref:hypothetical protein n=1 Tax=Paramagnetospirillum marisnigri TaxID=1285242 RepID=UPI00083800BD|nr:hypothetical protein [Paramagnetospirillum marisnigri]